MCVSARETIAAQRFPLPLCALLYAAVQPVKGKNKGKLLGKREGRGSCSPALVR